MDDSDLNIVYSNKVWVFNNLGLKMYLKMSLELEGTLEHPSF